MNVINTEYEYDVVVIGGGPGGSSAATFLAQKGLEVLLVHYPVPEKRLAHFESLSPVGPIKGGGVGESLVPYCNPLLAQLGVWDEMTLVYTHKGGLLFPQLDGSDGPEVNFRKNFGNSHLSFTLQVERPDFDERLRRNAKAGGVTILESRVQNLLIQNERVIGVRVLKDREIPARYVVDASGKSHVAARSLGWSLEPTEIRSALFAHFANITTRSGKEGHTAIGFSSNSSQWSWYIPLRAGIASVGIVAQKQAIQAMGNDASAWKALVFENKWFEERLISAQIVHERIYACPFNSYTSEFAAARGLVVVGDALYFENPIFSTGVQAALAGGKMASSAIYDIIKNDSDEMLRLQKYADTLSGGLTAFDRIIKAFHDPKYDHATIRNAPGFFNHLNELLAGNAFEREYSGLYEILEAHGIPSSQPVDFTVAQSV